MLIPLYVLTEKTKPLNFGVVIGQGISYSPLLLLQKSDFEDWVLRQCLLYLLLGQLTYWSLLLVLSLKEVICSLRKGNGM